MEHTGGSWVESSWAHSCLPASVSPVWVIWTAIFRHPWQGYLWNREKEVLKTHSVKIQFCCFNLFFLGGEENNHFKSSFNKIEQLAFPSHFRESWIIRFEFSTVIHHVLILSNVRLLTAMWSTLPERFLRITVASAHLRLHPARLA